MLPSGQDNPGYFPPIFGLFWAILDYLRLNPGYLPSIYRHIVIHCRTPLTGVLKIITGMIMTLMTGDQMTSDQMTAEFYSHKI